MKKHWQLAGAGLAALCSGVVVHRLWRGRRRALLLKELEKVDLLPSERGAMLCMSPPSTTVTFFSGSTEQATHYLRTRVQRMVLANPWLASRLEYGVDRESSMALFYNADASTSKLFSVRNDTLFSVRNDVILKRHHLVYDELAQALGTTQCKTSDESVGTGELLWKVSVVPDADEPQTRFAVVVSANHSLIDGHDFYRLYHMLSSDSEVKALDPPRRHDMPAKMNKVMGGERSMFNDTPVGFVVRFVLATIRSALFPATKSLVLEGSCGPG